MDQQIEYLRSIGYLKANQNTFIIRLEDGRILELEKDYKLYMLQQVLSKKAQN